MIDQEFKPFALQGYSENLEREKLFDVKKTVIDIKINFDDRTVEGKVELHIRMNGLKQDHLEIDAEDMEIYNVSVRGVPSQFEVLSKRIVVYGDFNPFSEYVVTVTYKAYPSKGAYFFEDDGPQFWTHGESEDNHAWFPCFDYPNTRSQYEIRVTVPPGFHVISNGKLVSKVEGEFVTYVFNEEFRFPAYLVSVVAGKFMKYEQEWNGIKITSYFLPRYSGLAERAFKNTPDMMQFISEKTGVPYPYSKYDQTCVTNFLIGGMENITATTLTDRTLHDEIAHLDYQSENLLCHELAHQWFGDYVTCKDWSHAWLNEGFATYIALLYTERYKGKDDLLAEVENTRDAYLKEFTERYGRPIVERTYKEPEELFDRHLYQKASLFLRYLDYMLGEKIFWKGVKLYLERNKMTSVSTEDFRKALSEVSGLSLEQTFHDFLELPGHPEIEIEEDTKGDKKIVKLSQTGRVFRIRVPAIIYRDEGKKEMDITLEGKVTQIEFDRKGFRAFSLDPESRVLMTQSIRVSKESLRYLLSHGETVIERARAALALAAFGRSEIPVLEGAFFEEKSWYVKGKIADGISRLGGSESSKSLMKMLGDEDYRARREVVRAISNLNDPSVLQKLIEIFEYEKGYRIRALALTAAAKSGKEKSKELLMKALSVPSYDSWIRTSALDALGELNDPSVAGTISQYLKKEYDWQTRAAAVSAISKLYWQDRSLGRFISEALRDEFPAVRSRAAESVKSIQEPKLLSDLRAAYEKEKDGFVRRTMREGLEAKGIPLPQDYTQLKEEVARLKERVERLEATKVKARGR